MTLRIFDDVKYVNTNETTVISAVDDITDVNMSSCHIEDNLLTGQCIGVDVKKTSSCAMCNKPIDVPTTEDTVTCTYCNITTLVCQLLIQTDENKMERFTCFNDGIRSFLKMQKCSTPIPEMTIDTLKTLLLTSGKHKMIADKSTRVIAQFRSI